MCTFSARPSAPARRNKNDSRKSSCLFLPPSPCFCVSADSKRVVGVAFVSAGNKGFVDRRFRPKPRETRSWVGSTDSERVGRVRSDVGSWRESAPLPPCKEQKSAEVVETKGLPIWEAQKSECK